MASVLARRFVSPISIPGRRLLRYVPLRLLSRGARRTARKFDCELPLVSFVDCLLCLILFLLGSFRADAPLVSVTQAQILLDGIPAASTPAVVDAGRLMRLDDLFNQLKAKRELWRQLHPGVEFPGVVAGR